MKIIEKTPFLNEKGELGFSQRIQGMMQYGFNWPNELRAQKAIITYFDRQLEKGHTLIRNYTLGQSGIMIPIILLGPTGIQVINFTYQRGRYEVKGDAWNVEAGEGYKPASVNLIQQTMRMAKALRVFIERQGTKVPVEIEPVLIAADPGIHIETTRPAVRVLMIDGIKSFVSNLALGQPVMSSEYVYELTERIVNPRPAKRAGTATATTPAAEPRESWETPSQEVSRARAIFDASQETKPFDPADFDFARDEEPNFEITPPASSVVESSPAETLTQPKPRSTSRLGMTSGQLAILAVLALAFLCILIGFGYYIFVLT
jgi:hypothetical protein